MRNFKLLNRDMGNSHESPLCPDCIFRAEPCIGVFASERAFIEYLLAHKSPCSYSGTEDDPLPRNVILPNVTPTEQNINTVMDCIGTQRMKFGVKRMKIETRDGKELLKLIGRRVLLKNRVYFGNEIFEVKILEASPRGLVKLDFAASGNKLWGDPEEYWLVEVLPPDKEFTLNAMKADLLERELNDRREKGDKA